MLQQYLSEKNLYAQIELIDIKNVHPIHSITLANHHVMMVLNCNMLREKIDCEQRFMCTSTHRYQIKSELGNKKHIFGDYLGTEFDITTHVNKNMGVVGQVNSVSMNDF